jgi:hypothetical protein
MTTDEAVSVGEHIDKVRREEGDVRAVEVCFASIAASVTMLEVMLGPMATATLMIGCARRSASFKRNNKLGSAPSDAQTSAKLNA